MVSKTPGPAFQGAERLIAKLKGRAAKVLGPSLASRPAVEVGFTAAYALWVHENMEIWPPGMRLKGLPRGGGFTRKDGVVYAPKALMGGGAAGFAARGFYWDPQGRAGPKFLEGPAREKRDEIWAIILTGLRNGLTLAQALLRAGLFLQREAQQRVPVDTGHLKASAFTRLVEVDRTGEQTTTVDTEGNYVTG